MGQGAFLLPEGRATATTSAMTRRLPTVDLPPPPPDALPDVRIVPPGPRSEAWLARLKAVESPNVTAVTPNFPVVWQAARGAVVMDVDGNRYLDAGSGFGVAFVGHNHPRVVSAAKTQLGSLVHGMGDVHPPVARIRILEALQSAAPGDLGHAVLCTGGSEAVEVALKTALLKTGKAGILAFEGGYHGLSLGALGGTWRADFRTPFAKWIPGPTRFVAFPTAAPVPSASPASPEFAQAANLAHDAEHQRLAATLAAVERHFEDPVADIGVVLVEPIQGRGGSRMPAEGFLRALHALCEAHGVLLCCDEIFTGCGRTGALFASTEQGVVPDLLCVGKALGGGWPISACLGRPDVMAAWGPALGEALHTSTFLGHPVACAAATETLQVIQGERLPTKAARDGLLWLTELRAALGHLPAVKELRGTGLMIGVELCGPAGGEAAAQMTWRVVTTCLKHGVLLLPCGDGNVIQLTPPVVMTVEQRAFVIRTLAEAIALAWQGVQP